MSNINERLDKLRKLVQDEDFLEGKGLSNEVNIRIFCYDPTEEMRIKHFVKQITTDQSIKSHIVEYDLYKIFMDICADLDILDSIPDMEESDGSEYTLESIHSAIGEQEFISKMKEYGELKTGDVMLITGVGDAFPFMRVHKMLEAVQRTSQLLRYLSCIRVRSTAITSDYLINSHLIRTTELLM